MEVKGIAESIPQKKMSPAIARQHPEITAVLEELGRCDKDDILEVSFSGDTEDATGDARKASTRALALRKRGYNATTRGTSMFVKA
jgi:hypothetical protein